MARLTSARCRWACSTRETAQILSGLAASDMVIAQGGYGLDEGTKVKVGPAEGEDKGGKAADGDKD